MTELTDIEISIKVAKIKGFNPIINDGILTINRFENYIEEYNPHSNEENCQLRDEFEVVISYRDFFAYIWIEKERKAIEVSFVKDGNIHKAVLLAIIESKGDL